SAEILQICLLVAVEVDIDRINRHDGCQQRRRWARLYDVAWSDFSTSNAPRDGRADDGPLEIQSRHAQRGLGRTNRGVAFGLTARAGIELFARDRLRGDEATGAVELHIGELLSRPRLLEHCLGSGDLGFVGPSVDGEEDI